MEFMELLSKRRSIRKYQEKPIEKELIDKLLDAALMAPSGKSKNPWDFIVIEEKETLQILSQSKPHGAKMLEQAALAIVVVGDPTVSDTWVEDCAIATIFIQLEATNLGLGSCWVQIDKRANSETISAAEYIKEKLEIPLKKNVLSIISLGYPNEEKKPFNPERLQKEKIHRGKY